MRYLTFDRSEGDDGVHTFEAMASTPAARQDEVMAEVRQVIGWARDHFGDTEGPVEDGMDWQHDLQLTNEPGGWSSVTLTLGTSARFAEAFLGRFGDAQD